MGNDLEIWHATYEAKTPESLQAAYKAWAPRYDQDTIEGMGYVAPNLAASLLDNYLESKASCVLDAGCGTGQVGEALQKIGYSNVDAMDYSPDMLDQAEKKNIYNELIREDMGSGIRLPENSYDATICVGALTYAHVGPNVFEEFVRITRPNGYVCFTIRDGAYQKYNYRKTMLELEANNSWELMAMLDWDYLIKESVTAKFCAYKVLET
ncbi:Methyltransferase type 11 [Solidesulfovibrio fructosivorans JJ]]|uniref:Methyltransferase type 11 n=1 Tax=Solidesulfovibrio fructosivorans JJ] TaxID=596151 RepID=E1JRQ7_SOLFR|nr:class I SAM-dependent methyltransferase [Solidesulfovibrio fructosivorans]EFL53258.1 Methyltransferase type 11 [Solidesulfovibrio fructosivorans JJ]]